MMRQIFSTISKAQPPFLPYLKWKKKWGRSLEIQQPCPQKDSLSKPTFSFSTDFYKLRGRQYRRQCKNIEINQ